MCRFCTEHAEGKKWYLLMQNYAQELLHEELTATQQEAAKATTRTEWLDDFFESFVMPAMGGTPKTEDPGPSDSSSSDDSSVVQPSEDEILRHRQVNHFGQVLPSLVGRGRERGELRESREY